MNSSENLMLICYLVTTIGHIRRLWTEGNGHQVWKVVAQAGLESRWYIVAAYGWDRR